MIYSVAIVEDGYVYGVLLMEGNIVKRAWIDPELEPGICVKMTFHDPDPRKVMDAVQKVLDVRYIPEVDPANYVFDFLEKLPDAKT